jgi:hypothetical protein
VKPVSISKSFSEQGNKRGFPWKNKEYQESSSTPAPQKSMIPKGSAFKAAFSENKKIVVKKTLTASSEYFSFKNPKDNGQSSKRKKFF